MRRVNYNEADQLLEVEGGALNSDIFDVLKRDNVNRAIVHGRCNTVGISVYIMGGGIGLAMREYGLGCDQVDKVELVLADGSPRAVTTASDPEGLFWAVCGGGGNLGFATKWRRHAVPAMSNDTMKTSAAESARRRDAQAARGA
jgi:FAD/FMN-containing dehydrogenase